jgi:hypothetical protein
MAVPRVIEKCLTPNTNVTAGKCLWRFDSTQSEINGGWVFVGCNCTPGKCCEAPEAAIVPDDTERETDCIDCPAPANPGDPLTSAGPADADPPKKKS